MFEHEVVIPGSCPFLTCLVGQPHAHPVCPDCGAVRYGNAFCETCRDLRTDPNPHRLLTLDEEAAILGDADG